ncbi:pullulanase-type alpha-1,6-glucosidase [Thermocatellispora tengchongensis]|uniref:1,4-alpha-D-glucan glucanohydrolase n=1 Tax=Thermocatellispora tengchongensis TaxID=1073253 RepID=A0A840P3K1_9ACTN|nr:pullulanase-type alpha-1,6-glucosidase [Thermocatellispora tengchongensis]MBB5132050.1 pullulanase-type alpha-1,6-glucosidase [Thermocatellispora tengchongensis]
MAEPRDEDLARDAPRADLTRERFYFAMTDRFANGDPRNDRGGLSGDRLATGFDPTHKGFYHGGDLKGLIGRLDYIKGLGSTAIWITPAFANRPVQGGGENASAGYHGYWITDFTRIDPHLGTNRQMKELVEQAHKRGMKVFFDIITNHTADVIDYKEKTYGYRAKGPYPYLDASGRPFDDRAYAGKDSFPEVTADSFPYTPVAPENAKKPAWLNDVTMYHNRGDSTFAGESSEYGDFHGLDDLWTERPEVVQGMIDIYRTWVRETGIDGFRIDTAKHVNPEFWERFSPALDGYAARLGNERFFMFGEVYSGEPAFTSRYSTRGGMDATLDFPFQEAARSFAGGTAGASRLAALFAADDHHTDADGNAYSSPTFLGNHDMGRIGRFLAQDNPGADDAELLRRDLLAHELMYLSRGQPVVYYGDEQGFTGKGGDQDARQSMFASRTQSYLTDDLIGTDATHAADNYVTSHPLYRGIAALAGLRDAHPALADGAQVERLASGGLYAFSRIGAKERIEYVVAVNNGESAATAAIPTYSANARFTRVYGQGEPERTTGADRTLPVTVPPLSAVVYRAEARLAAPEEAPRITLTPPADPVRGTAEDGRVPVTATVPGHGFDQVTFAARVGDGEWRVLGTDDAPTRVGDDRLFRIFHDLRGVPAGTPIAYKAVVKDSAGRHASARAQAVKAPDPVQPAPGAARRDWLVVHYQRQDGDYDGWGLHVWGDVEQPTDWASPLPLRGEDAFGRFAWIRLKPGAANVGLVVHRGDEKDGGDRIVNPARNGEVWLVAGHDGVYTSRAAAQGHATVRYHRPDGAYDGWGLHLWGDAIADGAATDWASPRMPDGTDEFGAYWEVPLKNASAPLEFIVHRGDEKDPGPDQAFTPAGQPEAYVVSGQAAVHPTRAAAEGEAVLHYHRPDGDYDGWGLHVWSGAAEPTEWARPIMPEKVDGFGATFRVPLAEGARSLSYIIHRGDEKDLPGDQSLDLTATGHEAWRVAATEGYVLPQPAAAGADADLAKSRAHWIDAGTVAWDVEPSASLHYSLVLSASGRIAYQDGDLTGEDLRLIRLVPGALTEEQKARWPHLAGYAALKVDPRDAALVKQALRGRIVAAERDASGALRAATGVQIPGVLDDVYAAATTAELGPSAGPLPRLAVWAPTAQKVRLALYREPSGGTPALHDMRRDDHTGVWSVRGLPTWKNRYYTFWVTVYSPAAGRVVTNEVTDPYGLALAAGSGRSRLVDLSDRAHRPEGWAGLRKPEPVRQDRASIYELHVRDFSASDTTVPEALRGTYGAFAAGGAGMRELRALARDGLTHVHLLPVFDFATVPEKRAERTEPGCDLAAMPPDSAGQQECVAATAATDSFNWGYDPLHYTVPEGSYASDPENRTREFRGMVKALNEAGLRVVMDVVYNHTHAAGQDAGSVLDRIVPGYYHRLLDDGTVANSTCCANTAPEHAMMGRLVVDSVVTWAREYKVDGFRFDLMGHHPKANILAVRRALDRLTLDEDGVDGKSIILYGEGWDFGEVAGGARFEQATQANMAGTGVGTFNDRLRDAVRGGGPFDADPRVQGFASGLAGAPNGSPANGTEEERRARLLRYHDLIKVGLAGNLRDYAFTSSVSGERVTGAQVDYNGSPAGYTAAPGEAVTYVDAHDNETLFDALAYKLPQDTLMADRVRMQTLALAAATLGQGTAFVHAGSERLRSKSLDRNSYDSGDWFNRLLWDCSAGNGFGAGLPPKADNEAKWPYARPLLADPALRPGCADIGAARAAYGELLRIRASSPAFALGSLDEVQRRLAFPVAEETPGVITMRVDVSGLDPRWKSVTVVFNATPGEQRQTVSALAGADVALHPVQAASADPVVRRSAFDAGTGTFTVPPRTVAVFVQSWRSPGSE